MLFLLRANSASSYVYEVKGVIFDRVHLCDVYLGTVTQLRRHEKNFSFLLLLLAGPAVQVFHKVTVILGSVPPCGTASEPRKRVLESTFLFFFRCLFYSKAVNRRLNVC